MAHQKHKGGRAHSGTAKKDRGPLYKALSQQRQQQYDRVADILNNNTEKENIELCEKCGWDESAVTLAVQHAVEDQRHQAGDWQTVKTKRVKEQPKKEDGAHHTSGDRGRGRGRGRGGASRGRGADRARGRGASRGGARGGRGGRPERNARTDEDSKEAKVQAPQITYAQRVKAAEEKEKGPSPAQLAAEAQKQADLKAAQDAVNQAANAQQQAAAAAAGDGDGDGAAAASDAAGRGRSQRGRGTRGRGRGGGRGGRPGSSKGGARGQATGAPNDTGASVEAAAAQQPVPQTQQQAPVGVWGKKTTEDNVQLSVAAAVPQQPAQPKQQSQPAVQDAPARAPPSPKPQQAQQQQPAQVQQVQAQAQPQYAPPQQVPVKQETPQQLQDPQAQRIGGVQTYVPPAARQQQQVVAQQPLQPFLNNDDPVVLPAHVREQQQQYNHAFAFGMPPRTEPNSGFGQESYAEQTQQSTPEHSAADFEAQKNQRQQGRPGGPQAAQAGLTQPPPQQYDQAAYGFQAPYMMNQSGYPAYDESQYYGQDHYAAAYSGQPRGNNRKSRGGRNNNRGGFGNDRQPQGSVPSQNGVTGDSAKSGAPVDPKANGQGGRRPSKQRGQGSQYYGGHQYPAHMTGQIPYNQQMPYYPQMYPQYYNQMPPGFQMPYPPRPAYQAAPGGYGNFPPSGFPQPQQGFDDQYGAPPQVGQADPQVKGAKGAQPTRSQQPQQVQPQYEQQQQSWQHTEPREAVDRFSNASYGVGAGSSPVAEAGGAPAVPGFFNMNQQYQQGARVPTYDQRSSQQPQAQAQAQTHTRQAQPQSQAQQPQQQQAQWF